jgi:hypothetical protein
MPVLCAYTHTTASLTNALNYFGALRKRLVPAQPRA